MSIYATLATFRVLDIGDDEGTEVMIQGVPSHIGAGPGYEDGDAYASFLPPAIPVEDQDRIRFRAVVAVAEDTAKGTEVNGQEYVDPLLVMTGEEYFRTSFHDLYTRIEETLADRADPKLKAIREALREEDDQVDALVTRAMAAIHGVTNCARRDVIIDLLRVHGRVRAGRRAAVTLLADYRHRGENEALETRIDAFLRGIAEKRA